MSAQSARLPARVTKTCLVTGVGGPAGQAAVRALKQRSYHVIGVDARSVASEADDFFLVPPATNRYFIDCIQEVLLISQATWLLPTVCEELVVIARHAAALRRQGVSVFVSAASQAAICRDKWTTAVHLAKLGIPVPRGAIGAACSPDVQRLGLPLVSRPRMGRGGRGVTIHERHDTMAAAGDNLIWQRFMPGTEYNVVLAIHPNAPLRPLALVVFEKVTLREGRTGNATQVRRCDADDVAEVAVSASHALRLSGPLDVDIRRDAQGAPRLLEINARIGAHVASAPEIIDALVDLHQQEYQG